MMSTFSRRFVPWTGATLLLVAIWAPGLAQEKKYKPFVVTAPDGVMIAAQECGNASGQEILFIHGFSQASLSWQRQVESDLAKEFRMITYDLRGHGNSDKPLQPAKYREAKAWADEVQAVIERANLKRPVLVGWSYGGRVIGDLSRNPWRRWPRGSQLRRLRVEIRSELLWRRAHSAAGHVLGRPRKQHRGDAQLPPQLLREAAQPG